MHTTIKTQISHFGYSYHQARITNNKHVSKLYLTTAARWKTLWLKLFQEPLVFFSPIEGASVGGLFETLFEADLSEWKI